MSREDYKLLDKFIEVEKEKVRVGSGDDEVYVKQIENYINKQRKFWIDFIKFIEKEKTK